MSDQNSSTQINAIADFYQLLAVMHRLPQEELAQNLINGSIASEIMVISEEIGLSSEQIAVITQALQDIGSQAADGLITLSSLRQAYTSAFTHPKMPLVFPYESQFLYWEENPDGSYDLAPRMFISKAALDAERCYKKAGLNRSKDINEPADHMPTELEFLSLLYAQLARLHDCEKPHDPEYVQLQELIREFSYYHIEKWGVQFFEKCVRSDFDPTYTSMSQIAVVFITEMLERNGGWTPTKTHTRATSVPDKGGIAQS